VKYSYIYFTIFLDFLSVSSTHSMNKKRKKKSPHQYTSPTKKQKLCNNNNKPAQQLKNDALNSQKSLYSNNQEEQEKFEYAILQKIRTIIEMYYNNLKSIQPKNRNDFFKNRELLSKLKLQLVAHSNYFLENQLDEEKTNITIFHIRFRSHLELYNFFQAQESAYLDYTTTNEMFVRMLSIILEAKKTKLIKIKTELIKRSYNNNQEAFEHELLKIIKDLINKKNIFLLRGFSKYLSTNQLDEEKANLNTLHYRQLIHTELNNFFEQHKYLDYTKINPNFS